MEKTSCPICGKELLINGLGSHISRIHKIDYHEYAKEHNIKIKSKNKSRNKQVICDINSNHKCEFGCNEIAFYQLKNGKWCCSQNTSSCPSMKLKNSIKNKDRIKQYKGNYPHPKGYKGKTGWSRGLTKENDERIKKISDTLKRKISTGEIIYKTSEETKKKLSQALKGKTGGYRHGGGRGKSGWYEGYWCDSSWELAFVIYNLEHNVLFTRNTEKFEYEFNNEKHYYIPDFIIEDGTYVEIKGYETEQTLAKYKYFPKSLTILKKDDLKYIFEYVENKYGKDFIKLYN